MDDTHKTNDQLIQELNELRQQIAELESILAERQSAEERSQTGEERFKRLVENSPVILYEFSNIRGGRYYSPQTETVLGYPLAQHYSNPLLWHDSIHPDDVGQVDQAIQEFKAGTSLDVEYRIKDASGRWLWFHDRSIGRQTDDDETIMIGVAIDITERKQIEKRLYEQNWMLQKAQEVGRMGSWEWDLETNQIYFSEMSGKLLGLNLEGESHTMTLDAFLQYIHPDDRGRWADNVDKIRSTSEPGPIDVRIVLPNGTEQTVHFESAIFRDVDGHEHRRIGFIQDITERKQIEEANWEIREYLTHLTNSLTSAVFTVKIPERQIEYVNHTVNQLFGFSAEEVIGQSTRIFYRDDAGYHAFGEELQTALSEGQSIFRTEHELQKKDGTFFWASYATRLIFDDDQLVQVISIIEDITDRKQAEEQLRRSEEALRKAQRVAHVGNWQWDIKTNHLEWSDEMYRIFGIDKENFSGVLEDVIAEAIHPEDRAKVEQSNNSVASEGKPIPVEYRIIRPDRSIRTVWAEAGELILDESGHPAILTGIVQDITERKLVEEELAQHRNHLEELVKQRTAELEAANEQLVALSEVKDEFVSNVSHELRSPITSIKLRLHMLNKEPDRITAYYPTLHRETERLEQTIESLLNISRLDQSRVELNRDIVDLNALVESYIHDRRMTAMEKGVTLSFTSTPDIPPLIADQRLLGEVLGILLTNAVNYTPEGGEVRVSTCEKQSEGRNWTGFRVLDTGHGIAPDEQPRMFERFYRGTAARKSGTSGTGLGLAIAKELVDLHQGVIEVESAGIPGKGAIFTVWLPQNIDRPAD